MTKTSIIKLCICSATMGLHTKTFLTAPSATIRHGLVIKGMNGVA